MYIRHFSAAVSPAMCDALIARGRASGFKPAAVDYYGELRAMANIRNNDRVEFDDAALALALEDRLRAAAAVDFPFAIAGAAFVRLGARFRLYRYVPGQYFKPHKDGADKTADSISKITALLYLDTCDGGETVLMPEGKLRTESHLVFAPRAGDMLLFEHGIWHEAQPVRSGEKHVARTDLFFAAEPAIAPQRPLES